MKVSFATRVSGVVLGAAAVLLAAAVPARPAHADAEEVPAMSPYKRVTCHRDANGEWVRVQCDDERKRCLYAPDGIVGRDGKPGKKLQRASYCPREEDSFDIAALESRGYTVERGLADAPHGWMRDARGRVFQVNFDLQRRMYVGGGYGAVYGAAPGGDADTSGRPSLDVGLLVWGGRIGDTRHRVRLVEGRLLLEPFESDLVLLRYDLSHRYDDPALRITSFFGKPRRHDINLDLGMWLEGGHLESRSLDAEEERLWRLFTLHGTVDLWQSEDMYSFVRVRSGLGFERTSSNVAETRAAITPGGALEADITFDRLGFHHLGVALGYERPLYTKQDARVGESAQRVKAGVEYEMIFLAINDQPLSLHLQLQAEKRTDSPLIASRWAARANAGLRFSLWAPARSR